MIEKFDWHEAEEQIIQFVGIKWLNQALSQMLHCALNVEKIQAVEIRN